MIMTTFSPDGAINFPSSEAVEIFHAQGWGHDISVDVYLDLKYSSQLYMHLIVIHSYMTPRYENDSLDL